MPMADLPRLMITRYSYKRNSMINPGLVWNYFRKYNYESLKDLAVCLTSRDLAIASHDSPGHILLLKLKVGILAI